MTSIFIAGSRKISRLNSQVLERIDSIIEKGFKILVGDANGVDKAVQAHLHGRQYKSVEVFCAGNACRNNVGHWKLRKIETSGKKDFDFYAAKDKVMAEAATYGLMIWDEESIGTLMNVQRLIEKGKKVAIYLSPKKMFTELKSGSDWDAFMSKYPNEMRHRVSRVSAGEKDEKERPVQMPLL